MLQRILGLIRRFVQYVGQRDRKVLNYKWTMQKGDEVYVNEPKTKSMMVKASAQKAQAVVRQAVQTVAQDPDTTRQPRARKVEQESVAESVVGLVDAAAGHAQEHADELDEVQRVVSSMTLKAIKSRLVNYPAAQSIGRKQAMIAYLRSTPEALQVLLQ